MRVMSANSWTVAAVKVPGWKQRFSAGVKRTCVSAHQISLADQPRFLAGVTVGVGGRRLDFEKPGLIQVLIFGITSGYMSVVFKLKTRQIRAHFASQQKISPAGSDALKQTFPGETPGRRWQTRPGWRPWGARNTRRRRVP